MEERSLLEQRVRAGGYGAEWDSEVALGWDNQKTADFASKCFPEEYGLAGRPSFERVMTIDSDSSKGGKALGGLLSSTYKNHTTFTAYNDGKVLIASHSYNSIRQLAGVIVHELSHMSDYVSGIYGVWANQYGKLQARAMGEVKAYGMQNCYGDPYFSPKNTDYQYWSNVFNSK
jgi:hypothetical protein